MFLSLKIDFVLANSAYPNEMPHASSGSSLFVKVPTLVFLVLKGLTVVCVFVFKIRLDVFYHQRKRIS